MTDESAFDIGDVVIEVPAYVGMIKTPQEYTIIATYRNEYGFWHVAETVDRFGNKTHVPLIDGTAAFSLARKAPTKPQNGPSKPHPYEAFAKDMERLRGDWEKVLGLIVKHWLRQR